MTVKTAAEYLASAEDHLEQWIGLLEKIVNIDSGPGNDVGMATVYDVLSAELAGLGFSCRRESNAGPDVLLGHRRASSPAVKMMLIGHADTVFGEGTPDERPFSRKGDTFTGPGVADMKGGLVVMLGGMMLAAEHLDSVELTVLVNGDEESGSKDSKGIVEKFGAGQDVVLVFEPGRPGGGIAKARRGAHRLDVEVLGKAAHTGVNPQDGANAIEAASHHVLALQALGREVEGATVTTSMISGGTRPNIVPDRAVIRVDIRFDMDEAERDVMDGVQRIVSVESVAGTSTVVHQLDRRPAFVDDGKSARLIEVYLGAAKELGLTVVPMATGGSSDGNFTSALGVPTLDGLGVVGGGYHTVDEYAEVDSLPQRASLFATLLTHLATEER